MSIKRAGFCGVSSLTLFLIRSSLLVALAIAITLTLLNTNQSSFIVELLIDKVGLKRELVAGANGGRQPNSERLVPEESGQDDGRDFVWCDKINDWALLRRPSTTNSDRLRSAEGGPVVNETKRKVAASDCIWPQDQLATLDGNRCLGSTDRIINQLKLEVSGNDDDDDDDDDQQRESFVRIAIDNDHTTPLGQSVFLQDKCRVNKCLITDDLYEAQAIVFKNSDLPISGGGWGKWPKLATSELRSKQIWIAYLLESPPNTFDKRFMRLSRSGKYHRFNWTATYRSDSDIVTPYSKFVPYLDTIDQFVALKNQLVGQRVTNGGDKYDHYDEELEAKIRDKSGSSGKVAWLVSNCHSHNNRLEFAHELSKYIQVDIFGKCGNLTCSRASQANCLQHLNDNYKFYLAFENSNNREYITEKLYQNAYGYNDQNHLLLPIVMGPPRKHYEQLVPPNSFIHVDDFATSQELANYLKLLDSDDRLYASYFRWKPLGRFIDTKFLCRICALMHETLGSNGHGKGVKSYKSINDWWWLNE